MVGAIGASSLSKTVPRRHARNCPTRCPAFRSAKGKLIAFEARATTGRAFPQPRGRPLGFGNDRLTLIVWKNSQNDRSRKSRIACFPGRESRTDTESLCPCVSPAPLVRPSASAGDVARASKHIKTYIGGRATVPSRGIDPAGLPVSLQMHQYGQKFSQTIRR